MSEPLDDRTFESVVPVNEEQAANTAKHFENKGYEVETPAVTPEVTTPPATPPAAATEEPAKPAVTETPAPAAAGTAPSPDDIDAETRAEVEEVQKLNDGEKLGRAARKNRELRELRASKAADDARIRELEALVRSAPAAPPAPGAGLITTPPAAAPPETAKPAAVVPEAPKAKEFDKPEPEQPNFDDFTDEDDPTAAYAKALGKYTKELNVYQWEKRDFDSAEAKRIADETAQQSQRQTQEQVQFRTRQERFASAEAEFADFTARTNAATYTPVLKFVCTEKLQDGPRLAYLLTLPEHAEVFRELIEKTKGITSNSPGHEQDAAVTEAIADLAIFRQSLKSKAAPVAATPAASAAPAASAPGTTTPPAAQVSSQTPSTTTTTKREDPAPTSVRGRTATNGVRVEDLDPDDSDARRELRRQGRLLTSA